MGSRCIVLPSPSTLLFSIKSRTFASQQWSTTLAMAVAVRPTYCRPRNLYRLPGLDESLS
ncbi:hypothetical protein 23 [Diadegma semiclausum ichnovirus]|nr:hypothetical protein 23 [Diadegma semiclausum ichnovirus]